MNISKAGTVPEEPCAKLDPLVGCHAILVSKLTHTLEPCNVVQHLYILCRQLPAQVETAVDPAPSRGEALVRHLQQPGLCPN